MLPGRQKFFCRRHDKLQNLLICPLAVGETNFNADINTEGNMNFFFFSTRHLLREYKLEFLRLSTID